MTSRPVGTDFALLDDGLDSNRLYTMIHQVHRLRIGDPLPELSRPAIILAEYEGNVELIEFEHCDLISGAEVDAMLADDTAVLGPIEPSITRDRFIEAVGHVQEHIREGDTYQVNLSFRLETSLTGSPLALYRELRRKQLVPYGALIRLGSRWVLSRSPELFVSSRSRQLTTRPMKGTAPRELDPTKDLANANWLRTDPKTRAENLMIVDLLRNDLSQVARVGTVSVDSLFTAEPYATLWQLTSTITAELKPGNGPGQVLDALFPCGSITGAPKLRTMELIRELECSPRGLYTGAIGWVDQNQDFCLSVAIRTLVLRPGPGFANSTQQVILGVGAGILADSDPAAEWDECLLKAKFLPVG